MPSLEKVLDMTIYEFNLRALGYARQEQFLWAKFRKVAFSALWSFNSDPKKMPKNEKQFMSLPMVDSQMTISDGHVARFREAMRDYENRKKVE